MKRYYSLMHMLLMAAVAGGISTGISGCAKKEEPEVSTHKISGTVYYDCAKKPYAGQLLELVHYTSATSDAFSGVVKTITDDFGRFTFNYSKSGGDNSFTDEYQIFTNDSSGGKKLLISRIPGTNSLDIGNLYTYNKIKLFVDIKADSVSTMTDTLFFGISESSYYYMSPIVSSREIYTFDAPARLYSDKQPFSTASFFFAIGRKSYLNNFTASSDQISQTSNVVYESEYLSMADCISQQHLDTVRVAL